MRQLSIEGFRVWDSVFVCIPQTLGKPIVSMFEHVAPRRAGLPTIALRRARPAAECALAAASTAWLRKAALRARALRTACTLPLTALNPIHIHRTLSTYRVTTPERITSTSAVLDRKKSPHSPTPDATRPTGHSLQQHAGKAQDGCDELGREGGGQEVRARARARAPRRHVARPARAPNGRALQPVLGRSRC
jgi:hypothetical protein